MTVKYNIPESVHGANHSEKRMDRANQEIIDLLLELDIAFMGRGREIHPGFLEFCKDPGEYQPVYAA